MSSSKKPRAGQPAVISAGALADAYRAADIVLGKTPAVEALPKNKKIDCVTVVNQVRYNETSHKIGEAYAFKNLHWARNQYVDSVDNLIAYSSNANFVHRDVNTENNVAKYNFGIVRSRKQSPDSQHVETLVVQVRGLIVCRCILFADANHVGPPIFDGGTHPDYAGYKYPVGNYYGRTRIISKGRIFQLPGASTHDGSLGFNGFPVIQECLIDLA